MLTDFIILISYFLLQTCMSNSALFCCYLCWLKNKLYNGSVYMSIYYTVIWSAAVRYPIYLARESPISVLSCQINQISGKQLTDQTTVLLFPPIKLILLVIQGNNFKSLTSPSCTTDQSSFNLHVHSFGVRLVGGSNRVFSSDAIYLTLNYLNDKKA